MRQQHKTKAIFFLIVMLSMVFIACGGNNNNPFEKVQIDTDLSAVQEIFGEPDDELVSFDGKRVTYTYNDIDFFGYEGEMRISYVYTTFLGLDFIDFDYVSWSYKHPDGNTKQFDNIVDIFTSKFNKLYGNAMMEKGDYYWYYREYRIDLSTSSGSIYILMELKY